VSADRASTLRDSFSSPLGRVPVDSSDELADLVAESLDTKGHWAARTVTVTYGRCRAPRGHRVCVDAEPRRARQRSLRSVCQRRGDWMLAKHIPDYGVVLPVARHIRFRHFLPGSITDASVSGKTCAPPIPRSGDMAIQSDARDDLARALFASRVATAQAVHPMPTRQASRHGFGRFDLVPRPKVRHLSSGSIKRCEKDSQLPARPAGVWPQVHHGRP
jgi:hypothetical protein